MKKFWEKYKIIIIVVGLLGLFVGLSFLLELDSKPAPDNGVKESVSDWANDSLTENFTIAIIAQEGCPACESYQPVVESIQSKYPDLNIYWFHTNTLSSGEYTTLSTTYDISDTFKGTPYTMLTYHGVLKGYLSGYRDEETLKQFLIDNGVISE